MTAERTIVDVRVRNANQTYTARAKGLNASCTAGADQAVRALAHKVFTDRAASVDFISRDGAIELWRISA